MSTNKDQFYTWLQTLLKDKGWQISRSGTKVLTLNDKQQISEESGYWANPTYTGSKPPRWIVNFEVDNDGVRAVVPTDSRATRIGQGNTAQGNVVGVAVRVTPVFQLPDGNYLHQADWEWNLLFLMPYPLPVGSSSETFDYDAASGHLKYKDQAVNYMFAALMSLNDPEQTIDIGDKTVSYEEATSALHDLLHVAPLGQTLAEVPVFDLYTDDGDGLAEMKREVKGAFDNAPAAPVAASAGTVVEDEAEESGDEPVEIIVEIEENKDLLGIDPIVYRQINAALKSGKQHLMFYGPPGTGKTTLARWVASQLAGGKWNLITGSADWSSQDIIGGYQPIGDGKVAFIPGILLKTFDQPLIIDELNRCDIDKVLGPLFTVLSGHHTTLPYRIQVEDAESAAYVILPSPKPTVAPHEFAPGERWRLIATINSIDKASLYQMSYALSRRFGWIYVDAPQDKAAFIGGFIKDVIGTEVADNTYCPLALLWDSINQTRVLGPAPFIDMIKAILAMDDSANFFEHPSADMKAYILDAFEMFVLPLMDGILRHDAEQLVKDITAHLEISDAGLQSRLTNRLLAVAV